MTEQGSTSFESLNAAGTLPMPKEVAPYDPTISEVVKGKEGQILSKAAQVIRSAGLALLPQEREKSGGLIAGPDVKILAYSKNGSLQFTLESENLSNRDDFVKKYIGDQEFRVFGIDVSKDGKHVGFLTLHNPVKAGIYKELLEKGREEGEYSLKDFTHDELTRLSVEEVKLVIQQFLESEPDAKTADKKAHESKTSFPGIGTIVKLYTPSK